MKKIKLLASVLSMIVCAFSAQAATVYCYATIDGGTPVRTLENVRKLTFDNGKMKATAVDNAMTEVDLSGIAFFSLAPFGTSGIENTFDGNGIRVSNNDENIFISADNEVTRVEVYSINGVKVMETRPMTPTVTLATDGLTDGVYIVKVATCDEEVIQKVIK